MRWLQDSVRKASKKLKHKETLIIGVDPGSKITGYGLIKASSVHLEIIDYGCIRPPNSEDYANKNKIIFESLTLLLTKYQPEALSVETQYVHPKNLQVGIKIGMTRGVIVLAASLLSIPVFEYTPTQAKQAVVGTGKASKHQVQGMIKNLLRLPIIPEPEDAADALALAICHANRIKQRLLCSSICAGS